MQHDSCLNEISKFNNLNNNRIDILADPNDFMPFIVSSGSKPSLRAVSFWNDAIFFPFPN